MAVTGEDILRDAAELLLDNTHERWTLPELVRWLNEGLRSIVLAKPSAKTSSRIVTLVEGTFQQVEELDGTPVPLQILDIVRNITADGPPRVAGRTIKIVDRKLLDAQNPNWHDTKYERFRDVVRHYTFDEQNPLEFYVYPGNTGSGKVEAVVSVIPTPLVSTGDVDDISTYSTQIDLQDTYAAPLLDWILSRAFAKDDTGVDHAMANLHYQKFATALNIKIQVEGASSPNRMRGRT